MASEILYNRCLLTHSKYPNQKLKIILITFGYVSQFDVWLPYNLREQDNILAYT